VQVDSSSIGGATKVAVAGVATQSDLVIRNGVGAGNGFATDGAIGLDGDLTVTLAGAAVQVTFAAGDSLDDTINKINTGLLAGNHAFEAFKLKGAGDTSFIEIRAQNTGAASSIALTGYVDRTAGGVTGVAQQSLVDGVDTDVYVNGIRHQQASNKFVNIVPGVSFEAIRPNEVNAGNGADYGGVNYNTINVSKDNLAVKKMIAAFGNAMNELSYSAAKNNQASKTISDYKNSDPTSYEASFDSKDSPLRSSPLLGEIEELFALLTTPKLGSTGDIRSMLDLGITIETETKEGDKFSFKSLTFADKGAEFEKIFDDNFNDVLNFFVTNTKVTPTAGNTGYVQYIPSDAAKTITDASIIGKDINLAVTYNGGAVTGVVANVNGVDINIGAEHIEHIESEAGPGRYNISFADTKLDGIYFSIDPNGAGDVVENSTINYSPGLVNVVRSEARLMLSDDARTGSTITEGNSINEEITAEKKELDRVNEEFDKSKKEMQQIEGAIAMMEQQTNMMIAAMDAILGGN